MEKNKDDVVMFHSMFQIIGSQSIELDIWLLIAIIFAMLFCGVAGIIHIIQGRVLWAIVMGFFAGVDIWNAIVTIKRIRRTKRKLKEEQELFDEVVSE